MRKNKHIEEQISSIEVLFSDAFEPVWMKNQREVKKKAEQEELESMIARINYNWREAARESRERISARFKKQPLVS